MKKRFYLFLFMLIFLLVSCGGKKAESGADGKEVTLRFL